MNVFTNLCEDGKIIHKRLLSFTLQFFLSHVATDLCAYRPYLLFSVSPTTSSSCIMRRFIQRLWPTILFLLLSLLALRSVPTLSFFSPLPRTLINRNINHSHRNINQNTVRSFQSATELTLFRRWRNRKNLKPVESTDDQQSDSSYDEPSDEHAAVPSTSSPVVSSQIASQKKKAGELSPEEMLTLAKNMRAEAESSKLALLTSKRDSLVDEIEKSAIAEAGGKIPTGEIPKPTKEQGERLDKIMKELAIIEGTEVPSATETKEENNENNEYGEKNDALDTKPVQPVKHTHKHVLTLIVFITFPLPLQSLPPLPPLPLHTQNPSSVPASEPSTILPPSS